MAMYFTSADYTCRLRSVMLEGLTQGPNLEVEASGQSRFIGALSANTVTLFRNEIIQHLSVQRLTGRSLLCSPREQ